ncbi:probable indole-3-acetic acid-amido synthetase GH3.9 [Amphibalanus amphitrite]|uniref:probable indole-3-acetic acid-amido synthetase GH3.9 n=1 Tax=Amphibalanus amphitrite TaxID=1232801 RepID=UPI001C922B1E|nr:probable indole-3-acetic acid-amido synthetase GH3.9 [Amphibalanus amphitrite]
MALLWSVLQWCFTALICLFTILAVDLYTRKKSRFHTTRSLLEMYLVEVVAAILGTIKSRQMKKDLDNFLPVQEQFVLRQIRANENTQYGRDHQFGRIHSLADFRRLHPVTTYSHYAEYVERAENGDVNAILGKSKLVMMACSSGTTGKSKHIPISSEVQNTMLSMLAGLFTFQPQIKSAHRPLYKEMQILCRPRWRYSPTGIPIGPLSGYFTNKSILLAQWSTPFEAHVVDTEAEAMYVSLLFGIRDRNLCRIEGGFASGLYNMLMFIETNWRDLVADVRSGRLKEGLDLTEEQRRVITKYLVADPQRADELENEFNKGFDGILSRIFPNLEAVSALSSGTSMALYKKKCLPYLGNVDLVSLVYGSSEAFMGINVRSAREEPAYALIPSMALVEFLPVDATGTPLEGATPLLATEVKVGELYEPVITNWSGFYRYRLGDVVKVVDFYHQAPCVDFQFRAGQMLNVHMEKLSEEAFIAALQTAAGRWSGTTLLDFTSAESVLDPSPRPGAPYYLVFLELEKGEVTAEQLKTIDEVLCEQHFVYKSFRVKDSIAPMKVMTVKPGTFKAFRQFQFDTTTAFMGQFKQPRVLRNPKQVEFFMKHVNSQ